MKVLSVCSRGVNRSRYLAEYLREKGYETDFCGVAEGAERECTGEKIEWADLIICTTPKHLRLLLEKFHIRKPVIVLRIRDVSAGTARKMIRAGMVGELNELKEKLVYWQIRREIGAFLPLEEYVKEWES